MLVIKVELHPFGNPADVKVLGTMIIANDGTSDNPKIGNYTVYKVDKFGDREERGKIKNHPRLSVSVWRLVAKAIKFMS